MYPSIIVFHCPLSVAFLFQLSPRLCPSTAGCSPPLMSSIVLSLLLSCFTFHPGFVHPLQDVSLHHCLPLSSVSCFPNPGVPSFSVMSPCHLMLGRPLDLFPLLGCHWPAYHKTTISSADHLKITVPVGWALNTNN